MIIDGRSIAENLNLKTQTRVNQLPWRPLLVDIVVGDDPASLSYVSIKQRASKKFGFDFELVHLHEATSETEVINTIQSIASRDNLCGLIVQLPLPQKFDQQNILNNIPPEVDVDLLNQKTSEVFYSGQGELIPPTAGAILEIIDSLPVDWANQRFLVLGQGELVGRPISYLLKQRGWLVETADISTPNTKELLLNADCIISGVGQPKLVKGDDVKNDVMIIDAGTSESNGSIAGDVDFDSVAPKAKYITPVPGGVGPITVAKLLENTVGVAEDKQG